ncbi:radical SAM protein [Adhaeribacter radiodurans]|uniref:Radical SAM protein n=1 Tax=Adhaeribacter radiodurans TaxID=2745197 RepID=A0A7L7LBL5_9BACT|nr:radical SAM protein [Adhaeribacter radiodurans]QMU29935.1 radical SAM protein [Adhaeribacter radiodurans]
MTKDFNHIESVYWVFTQLCNDECDHCYNNSGPRGERISEAECMAIIQNLPNHMDRLILSGGEPLADKKLLYQILDRLQERYQGRVQIMLQTNGDLLNEQILDTLLEKGVTRFDIASIDRYHKHAGGRLMELADIFASRGVNGDDHDPLVSKDTYLTQHKASWGYWGATIDMWLGGNWARGRAFQKGLWKEDPDHNFCAILSGGKGFLTGAPDIPQEISIQLWKINPCCPGTKIPLGDARTEKVADVLQRVSKSEIWQKINEGNPLGMGESIGITEAHAKARTAELKNICLWCDEFFEKHYQGEQVNRVCTSCHQ